MSQKQLSLVAPARLLSACPHRGAWRRTEDRRGDQTLICFSPLEEKHLAEGDLSPSLFLCFPC